MATWGRIFLAAILALWVSLAPALSYDEKTAADAEASALAMRSELERIGRELQSPIVSAEQLATHRDALEAIRTDATAQSLELAAPTDDLKQQIASLGQTPQGQLTEPPAVAAQRASLQKSLDRLLGAKSQLDVIAVEAEQLAGRVGSIQRSDFFERIFESSHSILNPALWTESWRGAVALYTRVAALVENWWAESVQAASTGGLWLIPAFFAVYLILLIPLRRWMKHWSDTQMAVKRAPDELGRLWRIFRAVLLASAGIIAIFLPIYVALEASQLLTPRFALLLDAGFDTVFATIVTYVLARRTASPALPAWRVLAIDDHAAARLPPLVGFSAFVSIVNEKLIELSDALYMPLNYTIGQSALSALALLVPLVLIVLTLGRQAGVVNKAPGRRFYLGWASRAAPLFWVLAATVLVALIAGYLALANYVAQQVFQTGLFIAVLFLLHHLADAAVAAATDPLSAFGRFMRGATGLGDRAMERLGLLFRTTFDVLLIVFGISSLFVLWTVTWVDLRSLANTALIGTTVGGVTVSLWSVLVAIGGLIAGIAFTNLAVKWFDRRILSQTRVDKGVQDSLKKGASYAGYILTLGLSLGAAGLDFSNIALIAGALGVGIGFGLQSIVNNFVSGLIVLAERPIRVGDWIALPAGEGLVKRINVRSTQIETFDNCTIILPNSNLITEPVKNWTLGDPMGRFLVQVTASYDSDAQDVAKTLMEVTRSHPKVLTHPEPLVQLARFGGAGLEFEIRANVADIFDGAAVASDIRFEIFRKFREKNITIAVPVAVMAGPRKPGKRS